MNRIAPLPHMSPDLLATIDRWPIPAQQHLSNIRRLLFETAHSVDAGPLDETLKWGQPAWRPRRPRTGTTLRLNWSPNSHGRLMAFVDCKTDLAAQMVNRFPGQFHNDGRRSLSFELNTPIPEAAICQLAHMTFTYHRAQR